MVYYNPMSNEFKEECKRLGLTGRQLAVKYQREGRFLKKEEKPYEHGNKRKEQYNETNICPGIKENGAICGNKLLPGKARMEYDKEGNETGKWLCRNCYEKYDPNSTNNIIASLRDSRTGNLDQNSNKARADMSQELACILYGWEDLNKKYDNYGTPIDCYDPKTGLYHQVQGRSLTILRYCYEGWPFAHFEKEWHKRKYEDMICFCFSDNWKIVERIYKFAENIIKNKSRIEIVKNPTDRWGNLIMSKFEKDRISDIDELMKANEIWKQIIMNKTIIKGK